MSNSLQGNTNFNVGAVVNPGADDLVGEVSRLEKKVESGATYFQTQAIFDADSFSEFMESIGHLDIKVLAGIMPIKSVKMAQYMNDNIPGIQVPDSIIKRIDQAKDVVEESLSISAEVIAGLKNSCAGVHIMAPGWETNIPALVERSEVRS
jgi:5,10-methylenetetrahydrofolate reductase